MLKFKKKRPKGLNALTLVQVGGGVIPGNASLVASTRRAFLKDGKSGNAFLNNSLKV